MKKFFYLSLILGMFPLQAQEPPKVPEKLGTCIACHGDQGKSPNPTWPNLGGQRSEYLVKRLKDYKNNKTGYSNPMNAIAATLSDKDFLDLAAYYSKQPLIQGTTPAQYVKRGEHLYRGGDFDKRIAACIACHGPKGTGNGQAGFPALAGQNADYVVAQLQAFKEKKRIDDFNSIMRDIAANMTPEDMAAVAYFVQGLYPAELH